MVVNNTEFTNISTFDSTLSENAIQKLNVSKSYAKPNKNITFIKKLLKENVISNTNHKKVALMIEINEKSDNPHSRIDYSVPLATAAYTYDPVNEVCYIGMISVQDELRNRGLGTQMKKYLNKYMRQEKGDIIAYTWTSTDGGKKLARKTGFKKDVSKFPDISQIWSRKF